VKLNLKSTVDFGKLSANIKKYIKRFELETSALEAVKMKDRIARGRTHDGKNMEKIHKVTRLTRKLRNQNVSSPPLNATGALRRSIKARGLKIYAKEYAEYQDAGFTTNNIVRIPKKGKKSQYFDFRGKVVGRRGTTPTRKFIHTDRTFKYNRKVVKRFYSQIRESLKK